MYHVFNAARYEVGKEQFPFGISEINAIEVKCYRVFDT